jgi:hypothetical protein
MLSFNDSFVMALRFEPGISRIRSRSIKHSTMTFGPEAISNICSVSEKVKQSRYTPWRRLGGEEYSSYSFSTSALDGGEWLASRPGRAFTPGERNPGTHCTGGWVGPRAGLDTEARGKILFPQPGIEPLSPGRPARSQTLYCLSYPGSYMFCVHIYISWRGGHNYLCHFSSFL